MLRRAGAILEEMGVRDVTGKADVMTTESMAAGEFMNRKQVRSMVDLTVGQSDWLAACTVEIKDQRSGEHPVMDLSGPVTEGVPENAGRTVITHPDMANFEWDCRKYQATWYWTRESVREALASGEADYAGKVRRAFGKRMGNDLALAALLGDTSLDSSSRRNRLLRQRDGWIKYLRASANRATTTRGSAYSNDLWDAMIDLMPEEYQDDPDLRWFMAGKIDRSWGKSLRDLGDGADLRDRAMTERRRWAPNGIPGLIVPQMPTTLGYDVLDGSTAVADGVTDNGDGTITFQVDAALGGYAAGNAGRRLKVTYDDTGEYEIVTVVASGGQNKITTTGSLGQSTVSTTAADYSLDLADITPVILTNPRNLAVVICDRVRAYSKFEQEWERYRVDVYYEADYRVINADAAVLQDGIVPTGMSFGA